MISGFLFFLGFPMALKDIKVFSKFFYMDVPTIFMLMLFPLIFYVIFLGIFIGGSKAEMMKFKKIFFFFFFFLLLCFSSSSSILFLFFLEMCACFMIFFIFNFGKDSDKISSCIFMFITNVSGSIPFMYFCFFYPFMAGLHFGLKSCSSIFVFGGFILLLASKLPMFVLHFWLTKAHVSASGAGSMILASLMLKIGCMGLYKWGSFFSFIFFPFLTYLLSYLLVTGTLILFFMNRFFDLKYLVACSSISHMSLVLPFFLTSNPLMSYSSILMMVGHGVTSCMLFLLVTVLYEYTQDRSVISSKSVESLSYTFSSVLVLWLICNLGFPPLISFISEMVFTLCLMEISFTYSVFFMLMLIISGLYFINVVSNILFFKKDSWVRGIGMIKTTSISLFSFVSFLSLCLIF